MFGAMWNGILPESEGQVKGLRTDHPQKEARPTKSYSSYKVLFILVTQATLRWLTLVVLLVFVAK